MQNQSSCLDVLLLNASDCYPHRYKHRHAQRMLFHRIKGAVLGGFLSDPPLVERLKVLIKSLYRNQVSESGLAASRAFDFLLDVVMEFKFGLIGELHGPVFQLFCNGHEC